MSEWIKCSDQMPMHGRKVLCLSDEGVFEAKFGPAWERDPENRWSPLWLELFGCGCCGGDRPKPTHWMPLPDPPKES